MKKNKIIVGAILLSLCVGTFIGVKANSQELKDGVYTAYADTYSENGYKPFVRIEVQNGRMVDAILDGISKEGKLLTKDKELKYKYIEETSNFPLSFTKELKAELLMRQSTDNLEKVTVSKDSAKTFKKIIDTLLDERIKEGKEEELKVKL